MFRHLGKTRTLSHNLKIASLLSFVAGVVNVTGFLAVQRLTTNVTGHFAYFMDEVFKMDFPQALVYFLYIIFFLLGSFVSNTIVEVVSRINERYVYAVPASVECAILFALGLFGHLLIVKHPDLVACSLLFAMGLQNSLVTRISNAHVRTTHLTGLFTDLGIELSQWIFYRSSNQRNRLRAAMKLRITIICFFFAGGIIGGISYAHTGILTLFFVGFLLLLGLVYDTVRFGLFMLKRKFKKN